MAPAPAPKADPTVAVRAHAVETFGSEARANDWLSRPNVVFRGRTPNQILNENPAAVEEELSRIDHGMFV